MLPQSSVERWMKNKTDAEFLVAFRRRAEDYFSAWKHTAEWHGYFSDLYAMRRIWRDDRGHPESVLSEIIEDVKKARKSCQTPTDP